VIYTLWLYRFKPGMSGEALAKLRQLGPDVVYPGAETQYADSTFFGRVWGYHKWTYGSVFRRNGIAGVRAEAEDVDKLLRSLRVLSPALEAMEVRNIIPRDDEELRSLGDDRWHQRVVEPWIEAARADPEVFYHLNLIGFSCIRGDTFAPYMVQAVWRDKLGFSQKWFGGKDARRHYSPDFA
jgi:hypothetical protein